MSEITNIPWTDHTFNIAWGCSKVSDGCKNCYADDLSHHYGFDVWGPGKPRRTFSDKHWKEPEKWNRKAAKEGRRHRVFCSSMCDVFEDHPTITAERAKLWELIARTPWLDWQLLTKRPERIADNLPPNWGNAVARSNVWLGTSIENNDHVSRADILRTIPATVRFVSYEPALGPLDRLILDGIDWIIFGGESGPRFREADLQWARDLAARCAGTATAFFFKQSSHRYPEHGTTLDGQTIRNYPTPRIPLTMCG